MVDSLREGAGIVLPVTGVQGLDVVIADGAIGAVGYADVFVAKDIVGEGGIDLFLAGTGGTPAVEVEGIFRIVAESECVQGIHPGGADAVEVAAINDATEVVTEDHGIKKLAVGKIEVLGLDNDAAGFAEGIEPDSCGAGSDGIGDGDDRGVDLVGFQSRAGDLSVGRRTGELKGGTDVRAVQAEGDPIGGDVLARADGEPQSGGGIGKDGSVGRRDITDFRWRNEVGAGHVIDGVEEKLFAGRFEVIDAGGFRSDA